MFSVARGRRRRFGDRVIGLHGISRRLTPNLGGSTKIWPCQPRNDLVLAFFVAHPASSDCATPGLPSILLRTLLLMDCAIPYRAGILSGSTREGSA